MSRREWKGRVMPALMQGYARASLRRGYLYLFNQSCFPQGGHKLILPCFPSFSTAPSFSSPPFRLFHLGSLYIFPVQPSISRMIASSFFCRASSITALIRLPGIPFHLSVCVFVYLSIWRHGTIARMQGVNFCAQSPIILPPFHQGKRPPPNSMFFSFPRRLH